MKLASVISAAIAAMARIHPLLDGMSASVSITPRGWRVRSEKPRNDRLHGYHFRR
jgi:hypothetical protein